jgi:hypothetical protein
MTDNQWEQYIRFSMGEAIPTDPEILAGLRGDLEPDRAHRWALSSVSGILVGDGNFDFWCKLIKEHEIDPSLVLEEGL